MNEINDLKKSKENLKTNEISNNESENEEESEDKEEKENSDSESDNKEKSNKDNRSKGGEENEKEEDEEEENKEEEEDEEENENNDNNKSQKNEEKNNNNLKSNKIYEEDKIEIIPINNYNNIKNNIYLEEYKNNSLNNEQANNIETEESKNLKIIKEIEDDLTEISDNIEKIFIKLDTSSIQDEKFLIDSLVIEAKKEGLLEETFGENEEKNETILKSEKEDLSLDNNTKDKIKINEKVNSTRINMSKIYEINNKNFNNNKNVSNNNINEKKFPYDYNKNRAYYESLYKKMKYNDNDINNNINNLKSNLLTNSDVFNSNEKNYFINNNRNINSNRNINDISSINNYSFKVNNNISNNLLSSTDTTGPFRYIRKNGNEPDLIELLMNKQNL